MPIAPITHRNIKAICALEKQALAHRSLSARIGDAIASEAGKMWFIVVHIIWFLFWMAWNVEGQGNLRFDPFPFSFLTMIVSLESIFLSLFILMSQNRSGRQAEERNHLDLQINLLSEDENTKMLQMLQAICEHHGLKIGRDPEIEAMAERTELRDVVTDLRASLPGQY